MIAALALAMLSSLGIGLALVTGRIGLRSLDARSGAAISIPTATGLFVLTTPFALNPEGFTVEAALWFALLGVFFPATVTILTFRSNKTLGPTITGAVSGATPLFALLAAALLLGESIPAQAAGASVAVVVGIAVISWKQSAVRPGFLGWSLLWPIFGAVVRGFAQAGAKAALLLWPNPFAASLIGYSVSSVIVIGATQIDRSTRPKPTKHGIIWFAVTGVLNGGAALLMYAALNIAPVSLVAPVVATYPLVAALANAVALREEPVTRRMAAGATLIVLAVVYLVWSTTGA